MIRSAIQVQFVHHHVWDMIVVMEECNHHPLRCPKCDMVKPWEALNGRHMYTAMCTKGVERKHRPLMEEEAHMIMVVAFQAYGRPSDMVVSFK